MGHLPQSINLPLALRSEILNTGGLVAGFTGAVNDAVLLFTALGTITAPTGYITQTNDANLGTSVVIFEPGVYEVKLYIEGAGANTLHFGVSQDVAVGGLTTDPDFATGGFLEVQHATGIAASVFPLEISTTVMVSPEMERNGTTIRFHATNGADAAPAAGSIVVAACYYRIRRINQLHV